MPQLLFDIGILLAAVVILAHFLEGEMPQPKTPQELLGRSEDMAVAVGLRMGLCADDLAGAGGCSAPLGQIAAQLIGNGNLPVGDMGRIRGQIEL